jgi:hypothetical protein
MATATATGRAAARLPRSSPAPNPWPLAVLTAVVMVLLATGVLADWPGVIHAVGLPPLGQVTDLRIAFVEAQGYPVFVAIVVVSTLVRSAVLTAMLGPWEWSRWWFAIRFYVLALPLSLLAAAAAFAAPATLFYLLFWIGFVLILADVCLLGALPWIGERSLWASFKISFWRGFRLGTVAAYLLVVALLGAVADAGGTAVLLFLLPLSAAATYGAVWVLAVDPDWRWLLWGRRSLALGAYLGLFAMVLVVVTGPPGPVEADEVDEPRPGSLLLMSGVDSSSGSGAILEIDPRALGYSCEQTYYYSYAGPGDGQPQNDAQCPIRTGAPYEAEHTFDTMDLLVPYFVEQVSELPPPVTVATHSQGVWVVWEALAEHGAGGVENLVLIGPFADNPVSYPPDRSRAPGRVGTDVIDYLVSNAARPGGTSGFEHDSPLAVELLAAPEETEAIWSKPLPEEIDVVSIPSTFDLPIMLRGHRVDDAVDTCPVAVAHPNLPYAQGFVDAVNRHLDDEPPAPCPWWRTAVGPLFRAFTPPPNWSP